MQAPFHQLETVDVEVSGIPAFAQEVAHVSQGVLGIARRSVWHGADDMHTFRGDEMYTSRA